MAEAEDLITDVARHATVYAQALWRRHRAPTTRAKVVTLADIAQHLDLLIQALFGTHYPLRVAQPPSPPTLLKKLFLRGENPVDNAPCRRPTVCLSGCRSLRAATDGLLTTQRFRTQALQQAMRAQRGSAANLPDLADPMQRSVYLLLEAWAADRDLVRLLPGLAAPIRGLRQQALAMRPPLAGFCRASTAPGKPASSNTGH